MQTEYQQPSAAGCRCGFFICSCWLMHEQQVIKLSEASSGEGAGGINPGRYDNASEGDYYDWRPPHMVRCLHYNCCRQVLTAHDTWFDAACEPVSEVKSLIIEEVSCICVLKYMHTVLAPSPCAAGKRSSATAAANASPLAERRWDRSVASACLPGLHYRS